MTSKIRSQLAGFYSVTAVRINEPVDPSAFVLQFPAGAQVTDWTKGVQYIEGGEVMRQLPPLPAVRAGRGWRAAAAALVVVSVIVAAVVVLRRRR